MKTVQELLDVPTLTRPNQYLAHTYYAEALAMSSNVEKVHSALDHLKVESDGKSQGGDLRQKDQTLLQLADCFGKAADPQDQFQVKTLTAQIGVFLNRGTIQAILKNFDEAEKCLDFAEQLSSKLATAMTLREQSSNSTTVTTSQMPSSFLQVPAHGEALQRLKIYLMQKRGDADGAVRSLKGGRGLY